MEIGQFELISLSFEARYKPAYGIYDVVGKSWAKILAKWPEFKMSEQNGQFFKFRHGHTELLLGVERLHVLHATRSINPELMTQQASVMIELATGFGVEAFTRIGTRQNYVREYSLC